MLFNTVKHEFEIEGRKASFETGKLARLSDVAVMGRMGESAILVTVNTSEADEDAEYFPLMVEYMEKLYAAGKISSSRFVKREGHPADEAILKSRIIDRSVRPRFPKDYRNDVQVIVKVLSYDPENDPLILAMNTVSLALSISDTPFMGPISGVRVGMKEGELAAYYEDLDKIPSEEVSKVNMVTAGDIDTFSNIDADMFEIPEDKVLDGLRLSTDLMAPWIAEQKKFIEKYEAAHGKIEKSEYMSFAVPPELSDKIKKDYGDEIYKELKNGVKPEDSPTLKAIYEADGLEGEYTKSMMENAFTKVCKYYTRKIVWEENVRIDGRKFDEIREVECEVGVLPRAHGSGLFTRGKTQVLTVAVLDTLKNKQLIDDMTGEETRRYIHYYEDAPFSFGGTGRIRYYPGRRGVGHGSLAEKALIPVLPDTEEFPYMMMAISEILSENGSSSMGSICGSTMALLNAGVPLRKPVAGIAMGVFVAEKENGELDLSDYKVITDMRGIEDFYGFMDFKVAGTEDGVTAIQFDTKALGLTIEIFEKGFEMAKNARLDILEKMNSAVAEPQEMSDFAPRVEKLNIPEDKIGELIGPGGKNVKELSEKTNTEINIEDDGEVMIYGEDKEGIEKAAAAIKKKFFVPEVGKIYQGEVVRIENYGAFVDLDPGGTGLVHVSKLADGEFVKDVHKHIKMGERVSVKVTGIDDEGKIQLKKVNKK